MGARGPVTSAAMFAATKKKGKAPKPPSDLSAKARDVWSTIVPLLAKNGMVDEVDVYLIVSYCNAVAMMKTAHEHLAKEGPVIKSGTVKKKSPWLSAWSEGFKQATVSARQLGIGFLTRARLNVGAGEDEEEMDDLDKQVLGNTRVKKPIGG